MVERLTLARDGEYVRLLKERLGHSERWDMTERANVWEVRRLKFRVWFWARTWFIFPLVGGTVGLAVGYLLARLVRAGW